MSGDRRRLIDQLFDQVLDSPPEAREEILARAEREDPDLRRELESLLAAHEHPAGILDSPGPLDALGLPPSLEDASIASAPLRIGIYRVVRELGRGGMGVVFLAERDDGHFFRQVAIKVIGGGLSADLRARFEAERQILASLDHPNIARLYDGGVTPDGHPYLVMEYVPGLPIDEYCRVHRLDVSERVRLFCTAARAVHEAHRSLVVHRDLKPSNILVTRDGEVKLLDFGIAKILDPSPEYAAPEQVLGGHITTATDVYGLGVVLFELLTGRRPLQIAGRSPAEWARVILQAAPPTPSSVAELLSPLIPPDGPADPAGTAHDGDPASTPAGEAGLYLALEIDAQSIASREERQRLRRRLRGDLDRILLTALRKEPERRYGSPARLVEDLERHLEGRPVEARADSAGYRMRKYVSRNRVWVGAAVVVFVSLIGGSVAAVTQAHRATRQAELAAEQRDLMFELFRLSDPTETLGDTVTAREILDRGTERIEGEFATSDFSRGRRSSPGGLSSSGWSTSIPRVWRSRRATDRSVGCWPSRGSGKKPSSTWSTRSMSDGVPCPGLILSLREPNRIWRGSSGPWAATRKRRPCSKRHWGFSGSSWATIIPTPLLHCSAWPRRTTTWGSSTRRKPFSAGRWHASTRPARAPIRWPPRPS